MRNQQKKERNFTAENAKDTKNVGAGLKAADLVASYELILSSMRSLWSMSLNRSGGGPIE
jgi:hypothetical protein